VVEERVRELADAVVLATAALRRRGIILRLLHSVEQVAYHSGGVDLLVQEPGGEKKD
jgi:hypothetical protein